ncbi:NAD(+)/NADH kinase [Halegenticoccus tardaugens]|uniref:NAD(+)/NADH kinase n=1 Tax=Halegenticoccus tardaugens TaxID=2071624 RepID=UPI00100BEE9F|nr:NAD(+)/NADH kinase [Halegenticoccus tardaugens]
MNVGIVAQRGNRRAAELASDLRSRLVDADVIVRLDEATGEALGVDGVPVSAFSSCDLVVSIGGDGTFLFAARGALDTPLLGVNLGEVGFLNAVPPSEAVEAVADAVDAFRAGDLVSREVPRIAARGEGWTGEPATNEIVVQGPRRGRGGGVSVEVRVDGSPYAGGDADGVLVATPTGSTAYNLSEGGPLVHPQAEALIVTEMCAAEGMPPLVIPPDGEVTVAVTGGDRAVVVSDGRISRELAPPAEVRIETSGPPMRLAGPQSDFFRALNKLD